jgi:hypothetical protein
VKAPHPLLVAALALSLAAPIAASAAAAPAPKNPCIGPGSGHLLCPDLRIGTPSEMYVSTYEDETLLHATSDVESRGRGPMEVRGARNGRKSMRVTQRIYKAGGGHITLRTDASLHFTDVGEYFGGSYWKVHQLARFELRKVRPDGAFGPILRTSPTGAPPSTPTTPPATRTRASATTSSAPRSAGRTSTPPTTTSSTSMSAASTAASSSR